MRTLKTNNAGDVPAAADLGATADPPLLLDDKHRLLVRIIEGLTLNVGDIELGAVEIKNDATDDRAKVLNAAPAGTEYGLGVRQIGAVPAGSNAIGTVDTELPAAAALADATANPTVPQVGADIQLFNGTTWDRARGDTTNGLDVDVTRVTGTVTVDSELPAAAALADAASAAPSTPTIGAVPLLMNATTVDRARAVVNALDSVGTGIAAVGMVGQLDDTATGAVTENQFAVARISSRRAQLIEGVANGTAVTVDSELPAAAALADAGANPTTSQVGSNLLGYNGTTWDRLRSDTANGLDVDVTRVSGTVTVDSELPTAAALADGAANPTAPALGADMQLFNGTTWDRARGDTANGLDVDVTRVSGTVTVDSELPAAAALADAAANPTTPTIAADLQLYNGTTWDRCRGDTTNGLDVDVTRVSGTVTVDSELPAAAALADAASAAPSTPTVGAVPLLMNATTVDRQRAVVNALDSVGTGIVAAGIVGQLDDTSPSVPTENQFSTVRISSRRALLVEGVASGTAVTTTPGSPSKTTYSASVTALAPAASATDVFEIAGSASKTVKVTRLQVSGTATAAGAYDFVLLKRSTANSGGTSTSPTVVPHDSNDVAGTAVVKAYTANPTVGTLVGNVRAAKATVTTSAGAIPNVSTLFQFGTDQGKEIVLRGTGQVLALNLNATTMTGGSLNIDIEWTEE